MLDVLNIIKINTLTIPIFPAHFFLTNFFLSNLIFSGEHASTFLSVENDCSIFTFILKNPLHGNINYY